MACWHAGGVPPAFRNGDGPASPSPGQHWVRESTTVFRRAFAIGRIGGSRWCLRRMGNQPETLYTTLTSEEYTLSVHLGGFYGAAKSVRYRASRFDMVDPV